MAKTIAYSKLKIKNKETCSTLVFNDIEISVKDYLPIADKLMLITRVLEHCSDENRFLNSTKAEIYLAIEIINSYTNLKLGDTSVEVVGPLYDELYLSGFLKELYDLLDKNNELSILKNMLEDISTRIWNYKNSAMGIIENISSNYDASVDEMANLQDQIGNKENLALLRDILTKLG